MTRYSWERKDWPNFTYSIDNVEDELMLFAEKFGKVSGVLNALPANIKMEAIVDMMVAEAIKTSEIEGEYLSRKDVLSSIKKNLGLPGNPENITNKKAIGIAELMIDVRNTFHEPLTKEKLFAWHNMLLKGTKGIEIGTWRTHEEPMQIVSGASGKEKIHFEAPPSKRVPSEMKAFIKWFNDTAPGSAREIKRGPVRAAISHLYFETIHPFEDGNGRIGRAIAEKALSQGATRPVLLSLSKTIDEDKNAYYDALQQASKDSMDITSWINYFVKTILTAQIEAEEQIDFTLKKVRYFDQFKDRVNQRQLKAIKRMLQEGPKGFAGGMNASKYGSLNKTSKATATRDLQQLVEMGAFILLGQAAGRSTSYQLNL